MPGRNDAVNRGHEEICSRKRTAPVLYLQCRSGAELCSGNHRGQDVFQR